MTSVPIVSVLTVLSREERGANTEPTGLGMERWCVTPLCLMSIPDLRSRRQPIVTQDGRYGLGSKSCVLYPRVPLTLMH
jgi:hypothetical protein